jgi:hypothetical protein
MTVGRKLGILVGCAALLAGPALSNAEVAKGHRRHIVRRHVACPVHRNAEGELVDCQGWRKRANATGWDNSCFNIDYLPSMYACSSKGRR